MENSNDFPVSPKQLDGTLNLCHYVGVLIFSTILVRVEELLEEGGWVLKQWLTAILLGAVNIEQTKLLNFKALGILLGKTLVSLRPQRLQLTKLASEETVNKLLRLNAKQVNIESCNDFYYDPHGKEYTGMQKILKGWCASMRGVAKTLYMDFIHTVGGHPVYIEYTDNYEDLRSRFYKTIEQFRTVLNVDNKRVLTFVVDRGIYSYELFEKIIKNECYHLITWQKGYKSVAWEKQKIDGKFLLQRSRNNSTDLQTYHFEYIEQSWPRNERMRQLRVQATNPHGRIVQVGVLTDDQRNSEEIITLIFNRWIQENDFKYLENHFGINEITSYASTTYNRIQDQLLQRQMKSGEYKALEKDRQSVRTQLKKLLFDEHQRPGKNPNRQECITELDRQHSHIQEQIAETEKEVSRLDYLIDQGYCRLDTRNKKLMDILKLIGRNAFYEALKPFKEMYDNYRDDHVFFRNLTHAHGALINRGNNVEVLLYPTANYPPKVVRTVEAFLEQLNFTVPPMPDNSGRNLHFNLVEKKGIQLAIVLGQNGMIY